MTHTPQRSINIFEEVKKLNFPTDHFMVVGSGIMAIKGIRDACDLDLVVSEELFLDQSKSGNWELKTWTRDGRPGKDWLKGDAVELMTEIQSGDEDFDLEKLKREGECIDGIWFLSLDQLIKFKLNYGRPKDFDDIALIRKYLTAH